MMQKIKKNKGFTLIEILVVIGIIAILAAIVLVALNPARQFAQARNSQRTSNVNAILNAVGQFIADNQGQVPTEITGTEQNISDGAADLCSDLVPAYMPALPADPDVGGEFEDCSGSWGDTGYTIIQDGTTDRITVCAPNAVGEADVADPICVTR